MVYRTIVAAALAALTVFMGGLAPAMASEFPNRPVTLIVPFPPGGPNDIVARAVAHAAAKNLGQPVVIENKPGGSGMIGPVSMARQSKPDGYTLSTMNAPVYRLPLLQKVNWDPFTDFTYIINISSYVFAVVTGANSQFKTWQDVVEFAKRNPGVVTYASTGTGGANHLGMERIAQAAGIELTHVPYKGASEVLNAVAGGHVMLGAESPTAKPMADAGLLRFLNIWTSTRDKRLPDVPTLKELGYDVVVDSPFGIAGPKGMDPAVVKRLHDAFKVALEDQEVLATLDRLSMAPVYMGTDDYRKSIRERYEVEKEIVQKLGLLYKE